MDKKEKNKPPRFFLAFFRWYCRPDLLEEIEGDLLEQYHKRAGKLGSWKAGWHFRKEVIYLFRPSIVGRIDLIILKLFTDMKKLNWIQLIALNLLMALCILLPFLPGPYDGLSLAISMEAQITGYLGLLLVPIGVLWLIQELKKIADQNKPLNNWSSGYYYAITATIFCTFLSLFFILALLMNVGISASLIALAFIAYFLYKTFFAIKELKNKTRKSFNATPLYLMSIPLIAFVVSSFFVSPVIEYSRNYAIKQAQGVIAAIENYRNQTGNYPPSIEYLYDIPKPSILGVREFIYELNGNAYNLAFVQHQHVGATREVVMYNKNDEHNVKGHFAFYNAKQPHWKFYWLD